MKKAKIMLMAITVFGVVGGALAFKASKFSQHQMCIATTLNQCKLVNGVTTSAGIVSRFYTTTAGCPSTTFTPCAKTTLVTTVNDLP